MAWELLLLYLGGLMVVAGYLLRKEVEMEKEPEFYKLEPVQGEPKENLPEELVELFGLAEEEGDVRGPIEAAFANYLERKRIESEIKTMKSRRAYKEELVEQEKADKALIEARIEKLKARFEAGLISAGQLATLEKYFPEIREMVTEAKELRKLKQQAEKLRLEAEIMESREKMMAKRDGLEKYRERWRRQIEKVKIDVQGAYDLKKALFDKVKEIGEEMAREGRSPEEIEFLKAQLKRDAEWILRNLGED